MHMQHIGRDIVGRGWGGGWGGGGVGVGVGGVGGGGGGMGLRWRHFIHIERQKKRTSLLATVYMKNHVNDDIDAIWLSIDVGIALLLVMAYRHNPMEEMRSF